MTVEGKMDTSKAAAILGRKGGKAGTGASKRRGDSAYYQALSAKRKRPGRKKIATAIALALLALILTACGGSPTGPSELPEVGWPAGTVLQVVGGDTGGAVSATVLVNGSIYQGSPEPSGSTVEVRATGYLTRTTYVAPGATRIVLWPSSAALPESYTRAMVYNIEGKMYPMSRLAEGPVSVQPSAGIRADVAAMRAHQEAINEANDVAGAHVSFLMDGPGVRVTTRVSPSDPLCGTGIGALAYLQRSSWTITGADIVFCSPEDARSAHSATHELGHVMGLSHSPNPSDVMSPTWQPKTSFSARERLVISMMYQRRAGNTYPDNDVN